MSTRLTGICLAMTLTILAGLAATTLAQGENPARLAVRVVDGVGEFYDTASSETFIPRGVNYIDFVRTERGGYQNRVFATDHYDSARVREAFQTLAAYGYNTARIFIDSCSEGPTCIGVEGGRGLNPAYLDNVVDLMQVAAEEGIYLLLTANDLPDTGGYWEISNRDAERSPLFEGYRNGHMLTASGVESARRFWADLMDGLLERNPPWSTVLGWQLLNEQWLFQDQPPLSLASGQVTAANGETYDLADSAQKRALVSDSVIYYSAEMRAIILATDPEALVTMGFFAPAFPHETGIGAGWYVDTAPLLAAAPLDFFDFHAYPGSDISLRQIAENFGMIGYDEKPILMGETGIFTFVAASAADAVAPQVTWIAESCDLGFDGWLYWVYYPSPAAIGDATYGLVEDDGLLLEAMAPVNQPDPCVIPASVPRNLAASGTAAASRALPDEPAAYAIDGTGRQWGSGTDAPGWIEVRLGSPAALGGVRLSVAQWPAGETVHRVTATQSDGAIVQVVTFRGRTAQDDVLAYTLPAPLADVTAVRVETQSSPSWVAWREVEVLSGNPALGTACLVAPAGGAANLRGGPSTSEAVTGALDAGQRAVVDAFTAGADGFRWFRLGGGDWVRADVVMLSGGCEALPEAAG